MRKCGEGCREEEHGADEDGGAVGEKECQYASKEAVEGAGIGIVRAFVRFFYANEVISKERCDHNGDNPTEDERDSDDGKEGAAELTRHAL